ncbi:MAG: type II toxin-antitoxin system VapC family toxin [Bacteroidales bacterium]|jgi:predicted nucleic acid-binding protein|nr:type II toxin-antitoxin system VapC family toxin [Bacteroidales bacterium]
MNIVDSSLWLEYFAGTLENNAIIAAVEDFANQRVSIICIYEVYKKMLTDKDETAALAATMFMQNATVITATIQIAEFAAKISKQYKLPMADSIIYATAKISNAVLWTQDEHFENLDGVNYFPK